MSSLIRIIFLFLIILVLLSFGASNLEIITIRLFPLSTEIKLPIYLFFYLSLAIGVIIACLYLKLRKRNYDKAK